MLDLFLRSLTHLLEPVGFVWLCLWIAIVWLWIKRHRRISVFLLGVALFMSIVGSSRVPGDLVASLERPFIVRNPNNLPVCDAVVVLGGGVRPSKYDVGGLDLNAAADRMVMGLDLVRRGKAHNLVLGGGAYTVGERKLVEADLTKAWINTWQISNVPVVSLGACKNTYDEALRVAALRKEKGWDSVLLVTSAYHMKRAQGVFRTAGVPVVCVPCDFQTSVSIETDYEITIVPRSAGFQKLSLFVHEQIGWWMYRWRGWIKIPDSNKKAQGN